MDSDSNSKKKILRLPPVAFIVCLGLSILGITLLKITKEYTVEYNFTIELTDIPQKFDYFTLSDSTITIRCTGKGFIFLQSDFFKKNRILQFSFNSLIRSNNYKSIYTIKTSDIKNQLSQFSQFNNLRIEITRPENFTIYFH